MSRIRSPRTSFFLHLHPERVRERTLHPTTTFGLGVIAFSLLGLLTLTGVLLMFWYVPVPGLAYDRIVDLSGGAFPVGALLRDVHRFASDALVVVVALHLSRVYLTGALGTGRRLNWVVGLGLLFLVVATAFTGYLLPWDADAYWAATVGGELLALFPLLGGVARDLLWGGDRVGEATLLRAFAYHVAVLPILGTTLAAYHLWRIRKAGGLARPPDPEDGGRPPLVPTRPALTLRELILILGTVSLLVLAALLWDAPLGLPGDPPRTIDPAKAPWFLLWIQELVSWTAWLGAVVPIVLGAALLAAPWIERDPTLVGRWFPKGRRARSAIFLAIVAAILVLHYVGSELRGPGWRFLW